MDIIQQIQQSHDKIKDIRASYKWLQNDKLVGTFQWGWKEGKEFYISSDHQPNCLLDHRSIDGEKQYSLTQQEKPVGFNILNRSFEFLGSIRKIPPDSIFSIIPTPRHLLGDFMTGFKLPFPECLKKAESITIRPEREDVDGTSCSVLEVNNILLKGQILRSILIWIDTARDYLPVKFESYDHQNIDSPQLTTDTPYENGCLHGRQDNINLEKRDGFCFPVSGDHQSYRMKFYLPDGRCLDDLTEEEGRELEKTMTHKEFLKQAAFRNEPSHKMRLEVSDIKINQGIEDEEFRIQFPPGCAVYDGFIKQYYVVGEPSEQEAAFSSNDWLRCTKDLPFGELIEILREYQFGSNLQKIFAAIKTLVERKPSCLPQICELLRATDDTKLQRFLPLILRAIGSKDAVPTLIQALANSNYCCCDYGLGDIYTPLDEYYHQLQIDPTRPDLGLGRPVREITIALEKITGHTEGHDHFNFYFYDENGERLKSVQMTDELKERIHERNRQVAEKWRTWWSQQ